ncbi:MAG: DNA-formamidopyrimidine glycosylase [Candidatus Nealsonbacteria bacterium]
MPELPEVETTVRGLRKKVLNRTFFDVWTDSEKQIKKPENFKEFKKKVKGKKINKIWRRGKNIIFNLSQGYSLLIHQKLTGHLLFGNWDFKNGIWISQDNNFKDRVNTYIHLMFFLNNKKMLALSDLRKFAKIELWKTKELKSSENFKKLGPEPLEESFTFDKFKEVLKNRKGKIKQVLLNQEIIVGIGNIYSDEVLWRAKIHPFEDVSKLNNKELKDIYNNIKEVLKKSIELKGESFSDYRDIEGQKGEFDKLRRVYRRNGEKCTRCGTKIERIKMNVRSAHFCPKCQKL